VAGHVLQFVSSTDMLAHRLKLATNGSRVEHRKTVKKFHTCDTTACVVRSILTGEERTARASIYAVFPADGRFVLQAPIVFWCHRSSDQPSVAVLSRLLAQIPENALPEDVTSSSFEPVLPSHTI